MKKSNLFLVLLTALIVMSCSKDETTMSIPQESNAIEFGTYVGRDAQTRASILDINGLKEQTTTEISARKGFGVFAHYTVQKEWGTGENKATTTPNFMYNQQVKWNNTAWEYSPVKYWPNNTGDKVSFFAYAPYSAGTEGSNISGFSNKTTVGDPTLTFTVNDDVKSQTDLVWGVNAAEGDGKGLPFLNQTKQTVTGDINFQFKHALARIGFNVEAMVDLVNTQGTGTTPDGNTTNGEIDANTKIVVTQVQLIGKFYKSGVLNLNSILSEGVSVPNWGTLLPNPLNERTFTLNQTSGNFLSPHNDSANISTAGQLVTNAKATLNAADSYIMVIPQEFTTDKVKIVVTYDVITKDPSLAGGQSKITNTITSSEFGFKFEHGKAYTFNLHLGMTSVKFDATVSPWTEVTPGTVVNVPINTETVTPEP